MSGRSRESVGGRFRYCSGVSSLSAMANGVKPYCRAASSAKPANAKSGRASPPPSPVPLHLTSSGCSLVRRLWGAPPPATASASATAASSATARRSYASSAWTRTSLRTHPSTVAATRPSASKIWKPYKRTLGWS
eukprot:31292-Pelagococcus_subviridis.AAC.7